MASPGGLLLHIFDPKAIRLEAPVRESLVRYIKVGMRIPFTVPALGQSYTGEVREIVPAVDPGSRTFMVKICLGESSELRPGMFGTMTLTLGQEKALLVPEDSIVRAGQLEYVRAVTGGNIRRLLVRTVPAPDGMRRVISGLTAGTEILLARPSPAGS